jgi:hypothetical protein
MIDRKVLDQLKQYIEKSLEHYQNLNQTSTDPRVITYAGHKADVLFDIKCKMEELLNENNRTLPTRSHKGLH